MMQNLAPIPREARDLKLDFTPVPRKFRHDGWTPERQKAFVEALADTGSVSRAGERLGKPTLQTDERPSFSAGGLIRPCPSDGRQK